ncbi:hypothetical protein G9C85_06880 [Halorubellus sp. JP-L1]|uniref:hypothetical protein n=1 Tax=Halorubellus sp. JP-L1 TaxID=2715753 RepID=UPI001407FE10|nr:hypothetical protein [Halorubellus sp. JP-L1]NHN41361.1 hypothetical protein [Halorubellus sp. JP-L1]
MTHPTEAHEFTFGCYRTEEVPDVDDAENATTDDPTVVTDGGPGGATTCPACENDLANVQGVPACTRCAWNAN